MTTPRTVAGQAALSGAFAALQLVSTTTTTTGVVIATCQPAEPMAASSKP